MQLDEYRLESLLGQSYRNIRNLLAHPYANHFIDLHSQRGRKVTLRIAMAEEPLTGESAGSFWLRQPHSQANVALPHPVRKRLHAKAPGCHAISPRSSDVSERSMSCYSCSPALGSAC